MAGLLLERRKASASSRRRRRFPNDARGVDTKCRNNLAPVVTLRADHFGARPARKCGNHAPRARQCGSRLASARRRHRAPAACRAHQACASCKSPCASASSSMLALSAYQYQYGSLPYKSLQHRRPMCDALGIMSCMRPTHQQRGIGKIIFAGGRRCPDRRLSASSSSTAPARAASENEGKAGGVGEGQHGRSDDILQRRIWRHHASHHHVIYGRQ